MQLSPDSPRREGARRFGLELRRAMRAQSRTARGLSREAGIGRTRLQNWLSGLSLPSVERTELLADLLAAPRLVELVREARLRACDACGRDFVVEHASPARYCSLDCRRHQAKRVSARRDLSRAVLQRRVGLLDRAIGAMCAECEPSGVCQTPTCPLQLAGVSPAQVARSA
jgi:transcriptional regulator with XRE-family HTH domain